MKLRLNAWQLILISLVLGAIVGLSFGPKAMILQPIGELFIRAIHMIIVPVVFFAITNAVCSMDCLNKMKRIGLKAVFIYSFFMLLSSFIGILSAALIKPGIGINTAIHSTPMNLHHTSIAEAIVGILPTNIFQSFVSGNIIQIIIFSLILGFALNTTKHKTQAIHDLVDGAFQLIIKVAQIVMKMAPLGVFALIACMTGKYGLSIILPLLKLILSVYIGCLLVWICYALCLLIVTRKNPGTFFQLILKPILISYTTSSSAATLPVTLNCAINELKIEPSIANFLLPLGTSLNLNGLSVYLSVATIFAANFFGIHLSIGDYFLIPFLVLGTAVGAAAVPGSALIVMGAIQSSLGIPLGAIPLIAAVDRLNDMAQTSTNVVGDLLATKVIDEVEQQHADAVELQKQVG